jgi:hypothetical protein
MVMLEELAKHNIHVFLEYYGITNDQGQKLDFHDHPFMWDIYEDWSPVIVGRKAAQVTWSTCFNIKSFYAAKNFGWDIIYSLPSANDIREFVGSKVNRLIGNNPILQKWTEDKDSIEQKRVGSNVIHYRGTWTERAAIAIPADLYISDETDRSKQDVVSQYETRLQHSKFGYKWYFSNPSAPGTLTDKLWEQSDQKHWFITCGSCNKDQFLTMENIQGSIFACLKCGKELNRRKGRWVKRWKDRDISGYWVSLLMAPWVSAQDILKKKREYTDEQFSNFVLGEPYVGKGNTLTKQMFFQNLVDKVNPQDSRPIIGVDTGAEINYVIGNKYGLYYYGKCKNYNDLEKYMNRWPNAIMVIDQGGDIIGPRALREKYPNRVFLCFFRQDRKNDELIQWNDTDGTVVADRNKMLQLIVDEFSNKLIPLYGAESDWWDVWVEFSGMYRTAQENSLGVMVHQWNKPSSGRCDYPFAVLYWRLGMDRFMETSSTFHDPSNVSFASPGLDVRPDGTASLPR